MLVIEWQALKSGSDSLKEHFIILISRFKVNSPRYLAKDRIQPYPTSLHASLQF